MIEHVRSIERTCSETNECGSKRPCSQYSVILILFVSRNFPNGDQLYLYLGSSMQMTSQSLGGSQASHGDHNGQSFHHTLCHDLNQGMGEMSISSPKRT